jgi:hypothetical protein
MVISPRYPLPDYVVALNNKIYCDENKLPSPYNHSAAKRVSKFNLCSAQEESATVTRVWQLYEVRKRESSPGAKRPANETDRSTQTSYEIKNDWS